MPAQRKQRDAGVTESYDVYRLGERTVARGRITGQVVETGDDAARVLQRTLDLVGEQGGGQVQLQPGVYALARPLRVPSRVTLQGSGRGRERFKPGAAWPARVTDGDALMVVKRQESGGEETGQLGAEGESHPSHSAASGAPPHRR